MREGHASLPAAPAFITPYVFKVLQEKHDLKLNNNTDPLADLSASIGNAVAANQRTRRTIG